MSQPHPPIPEPQSNPYDARDDDEPRTQSILLPPSQRQPDQPERPAPVGPPTAAWTTQAEPASPGQPLPGQPAPAPPGAGSAPGAPTQHTGPLGFVPGFAERPSASGATSAPPPTPGPSTAPGVPSSVPPDAPSGTHRRSLTAGPRSSRAGAVLIALGLAVLALVLLEIGLVLDFGTQSLWAAVTTWSAFGTAAALVVLVAVLGALTHRLPGRTAWRIGAAGAAALAATWVLIGLPLAASDRGFWLTAATAAAGAAVWLVPGRGE